MAQNTVRIDEHELAHAREAISVTKRSLSAQVTYWMNIGRIIESSPSFSLKRIEEALRAEINLDELSSEEREFFEARFDAYMTNGFSNDPAVISAYAALGDEGIEAGYDPSGETEADLY